MISNNKTENTCAMMENGDDKENAFDDSLAESLKCKIDVSC